ncbi:MAG: hypothetical protein LC772_12115, partial [Chloroflexi bacterium]|nr:hypothetical protein [Chloroflexota bacterium]
TASLELARPGLVQLFRRILRNNDPQAVQDLRAVALPGSPAMDVAERLMDESPSAGAQVLAAIGTPEALNRLQDFVALETAPPGDRIVALGYLRDAGAIAEDEPVDLPVQGATLQLVLGRHRIVPERPVSVPDETAAELFDTAARSLELDPEAAYSGFEALDEYYGESAEVKIRLARLSLESGRLDESRTWIEQALALEPESVGAHMTLASLCLLEGDLRGAVEQSRFVEQAENMTPSEVLAYHGVQESLNTLLESPLADALMAQADLAQDDESAEANRELAGMLGAMWKMTRTMI